MENKIPDETERLTIRRWNISDAPALFRYASDPHVSELAMWPCHTSIAMSREVLENYFIPNRETFAIVLKENGRPTGCIGLVPEGDENFPVRKNEREVGYWIGRPYWNLGLTTEALTTFISYCRDSLHLDSLVITTHITNIASQRVALKCGFSFICDYDHDGIPSRAYRLVLHR